MIIEDIYTKEPTNPISRISRFHNVEEGTEGIEENDNEDSTLSNSSKGMVCTFEMINTLQENHKNISKYLGSINHYITGNYIPTSEYLSVGIPASGYFAVSNMIPTTGYMPFEVIQGNCRILKLDTFEVELWKTFKRILNSDSEYAYVFLYNKLREESIKKDINNCNNFLSYIINDDLSSDIIIHVANVLSPIKSKLSNWDKFTEIAKKQLIEKKGEKYASKLIRVF